MTKKARVASPKHGDYEDKEEGWQQHMIDVLDIENAEQQATCMQLVRISQALNYIIEAVYHHFIVGSKESTKGKSEMVTHGFKRWET